jgi:VCBS repeat-containing protein
MSVFTFDVAGKIFTITGTPANVPILPPKTSGSFYWNPGTLYSITEFDPQTNSTKTLATQAADIGFVNGHLLYQTYPSGLLYGSVTYNGDSYSTIITTPTVQIHNYDIALGQDSVIQGTFEPNILLYSGNTLVANLYWGLSVTPAEYSGVDTIKYWENTIPGYTEQYDATTGEFTSTYETFIAGTVGQTLSLSPTIAVNISDVEILEGNTGTSTLTFNVDLSHALSEGSLTVSIESISPETDPALTYKNALQAPPEAGDVSMGLLSQSTFTFTPESGTRGTLSVTVNGDFQIEPDEKFTVQIAETHTTTQQVLIGRSTAIGTIRNDDGAAVAVTVTGLSILDPMIQSYVKQDIEAAVGRIQKALGAPLPHLEIAIQLDADQPLGGAHAIPQVVLDPASQYDFFPTALAEARSSIDPNGAAPDMIIEVSLDTLTTAYSGLETTTPIDMTELLSHEIIHGLGFGGSARPWNTLVTPNPIGAPEGTVFSYVGSRGVAFAAANGYDLIGGGIPLVGGAEKDANGNLVVNPSGVAHIEDSIRDLMNPIGLSLRTEPVSGLDAAILRDLGYGGRGQAIKGYLQGATIVADENANGLQDAGEVSDITDASGGFTLFGGSPQLIVFGGVDTSTGLPFRGQLLAPAGYAVITPLTTLVATLQGQEIASADQKVLAEFGLPSHLDLSSFDPIATAQVGDATGAAVEVAAAKVYSTASLIGSGLAGVSGPLGDGIQAGFSSIASAIDAGSLSLTDITAVSGLISSAAQAQNIPLASGAAGAIASIIVASNIALDQAAQVNPSGQALLDAVATIQLVIQGAASNAIEQAAGNADTLAAVTEAFTGSNLSALIALAASDLAGEGQNQAPVAFNLSTTTEEDTSVTINFAGADIDVDQLTYSIVTAPTKGTVVLDGASFTYTPSANYNGSDAFTFKANDGNLDSIPATVAIAIDAVNDPAVITGAKTGSVIEDGQLTATGQLTVADPDSGEASFQAATIAGAYGSLVLSAGGAWTYALDNNNNSVQALTSTQTLPDTLQVLSADGTTASINITINGADDLSANVVTGTGRGEMLRGTSADDIITPFAGRDIVNARSGDDIIKATLNDGSDFYYGDGGSDTIDYSTLTQRVEVKLGTLFGIGTGMATGRQNGVDVLGSIENVVGSQADDKIKGNSLANVLDGGAGNDRMEGGGGSDSFVFKPDFGKDRITNFDVNPAGGQDFLDISAFGITNADFRERVAIADVGADTLVTIDGDPNQTIRLVGIGNASTVSVDDFLLL